MDLVCTKCHNTKAEGEFAICGSRSTGRQSWCRDCKSQHYVGNKQAILLKCKEYRDSHSIEKAERDRRYYFAHRSEKAAYDQVYRRANAEGIAQYHKKYKVERRKRDLPYKLASYLRSRLTAFVAGRVKGGSAVHDLGCTLETLVAHLESRFYPNPETGEPMTWNNYGLKGWHIDHIVPLVLFDLADHEQCKKACHYTNLQPLWAKDNLRKGGRRWQ